MTTQMILMRGAGADKIASRFNVENTLMAAINGVMFEDMNDNNTTRYVIFLYFILHIRCR